MLTQLQKYNIGCGRTKLDGYVNVDINPGENVDVVCDIRTGLLQFPTGESDEILCFHTIEHLERHVIPVVLHHFSRMLQIGGKLVLSFPDFAITSQYFLENKRGQKDFWEATIFGRGSFPHDEHKCALVSKDVIALLTNFGFKTTKQTFEPVPNECNTIIYATKIHDSKSYLELYEAI